MSRKGKSKNGGNRKRRPVSIPSASPIVVEMTRPVQRITQARQLRNDSTVNRLALAMALPGQFPAVQLPNSFSQYQTAVAKLKDARVIDLSTPRVNETHPGEALFAISRSMYHMLAKWHGILDECEYLGDFYDQSTQTIQSYDYTRSATYTSSEYLVVHPIQPVFVHHLSGPTTYDLQYYPFFQDERTAFWLNATVAGGNGAVVQVSVTLPGLVTDNFEICLTSYVYSGRWIESQNNAATAPGGSTAVVSLSLTNSGYYSFDLCVSSLAQFTFLQYTFKLKESAEGLSFHSVPRLHEFIASVGSARVNAASLLVTCTAPPLYANGTITCVQLPETRMLTSVTTQSNWTNELSTVPGYQTFKFVDGYYGYHRATTITDFQLQDRHEATGNALRVVKDPIIQPAGWLVCVGSTTAVGATYPGAFIRLVVDSHIEFQTSSMWLTAKPPPSSERLIEQALNVLRSVPQHHENPLHLSDIWEAVKSKGLAVLKQAPAILSIMGNVFPSLKAPAAILGAAEALSRL